MTQFKLLNRILGGLVFIVAMATYGLTIEPTASFWDCPEFISTAAKLEVGHPPGAPFFMLTGKFVSLFASEPTQIAYCINMLSAFFSALTILFLFFTITHLARRMLVNKDQEMSTWQLIVSLGSGVVGALAYTFSDTFWFSAVEAEVYAYSSFLTAIVFWLILKWEEHADEPQSDRYLLLITYLMGLSIGVHLLNLLTIPAIVLVYYYKKFENANWKGMLVALLVSFAILGFILYGLVPGFINLAGYVELLFVNTLGLPFNSGALFYCFLTVAVLIWSILELYKSNPNELRIKISSLLAVTLLGIPFVMGSWWIGLGVITLILMYFIRTKALNIRLMSTVMTALALMLLGYSCYALIVVRSVANPPMDQNSPDNVFALKSYLNREQYGDRPLFYGAYYSSEPKLVSDGQYCRAMVTEGEKVWGMKEKTSADEKDQYIVTDVKQKVEYDSKFKTLFPRMHSNSGEHPRIYESWVNIKGKKVTYDQCGYKKNVTIPTFAENLEFFFKYQLNYMYWRYFMWNFSGRQNDIQGHGEISNGNWITGFNFIDSYLVGDQSNLSAEYASNKGRNVYYLLPLILGILGMVYMTQQGKKGMQNFWITFVLFFMTGIAIVLYLNQGPYEPRERDYAYAGSFYAFCIWVGFGVAGLAKMLENSKLSPTVTASIALALALPAPIIMAHQNWDDHDRSDRYLVRDFGKNYFNSCAPNAIIFTNGDNDTFPLWYLQETEEDSVSLDTRVCNLSYLQTDWYIDQMRRPAYLSDPLPISWKRPDYAEGIRSLVRLEDRIAGPVDLKTALNFLLQQEGDATNNILPCKKFSVPVNVDNLIKQGAITEAERDHIATEMIIDLSNKRFITKSELMILEMIAQNNWERPIYFAVTVGSEMHLGMTKHFQLEGLAYRLVPHKNASSQGVVASRIMYDNMMNLFAFGGINNPSIYLDENSARMCRAHRQMFDMLIEQLIKEGENEKALKALDYCMEQIPGTTVPHNYSSTSFVEYYYKLGEKDKAQALADEIGARAADNLRWLNTLTLSQRRSASEEITRNLASIQRLALASEKYNYADYIKYYEIMASYSALYNSIL
jgi:hypothetical protein